MKAIVYTSNTGFTEKYAKLLSEKTGLTAYELNDAKEELSAGDEVFYMGWLMAGGVKGLKKAKKLFSVKGCCAVGMAPVEAQKLGDLKSRNSWTEDGFFVLQGGYAPEKLRGINKLMLNMFTSVTTKKLSSKKDLSVEDRNMLQQMSNGFDAVNAQALEAVVALIKN